MANKPDAEILRATREAEAAVPHVDQYFGPWAMAEDRFLAMADRARSIDLAAHLEAVRASGPAASAYGDRDYEVTGGVALIPVSGMLMKFTSSMAAGTSTVRLRRQIRDAAANDDVRAIVLVIDSPGGTVAGTSELARDVREAAKAKPVHAQVDDLCASAAYWIASQCGKVFANKTAMVGSIGTYGVVQDTSQRDEAEGVKVHVVRAGAYKGWGTPGTKVTEEHLAEWQRIINELNGHFLQEVAAGRKLSDQAVAALADGRVHLADEAVTLRLIDAVQTLEQTISFFKPDSKARKVMSENDTKPLAATINELEAALPGADAAFLMGQLKAGATLTAAMSAWMAEQHKRLEAATAAAATAKADAEKARADAVETTKKNGVKALVDGAASGAAADGGGDAVEQFNAAVAEKVKAGVDRQRAIASVADARPDLHQAYLLATNPTRKARRLIDEKYGD